jgi:HEAT repeat protein
VAVSELIIDFNTIVAAVSWFAVAVLLFAIALVVRSMSLRGAAARRECDLELLRKEWDSNPRVPRKYTLEWILLWNQARASAREPVPVGKQVRAQALRWIKRGDVVERIASITLLGHVREPAAVPALRVLCDSSNALISVFAARALLQIEPHFAKRFVMMMYEREDWAAGKVASIVREERDLLAAPLLDACSSAPVPVARALVPYVQYLDAQKAAPVLRNIVRTVSDAETLAAALKALAVTGSAADASVAAKLAADERWQVRVQAANALSALGDESHIPLLAAMLGDRRWWVRHRAAQAIAAVAGRCKADIASVISEREDPFARDALVEALAEHSSTLKGVRAS